MRSAALESVLVSAAAVGDPESTRRVYASIFVLIGLGVAMAALAIWLFRRTRPEPELLAPLEAMESRRWRTSEPAEQARVLDAKRPDGAKPLRRSTSAPTFDTEFDDARPVRSFDDLADDAPMTDDEKPNTAALDPTPLGTAKPVEPEDDDERDDASAIDSDEPQRSDAFEPVVVSDDDTLERDRPAVTEAEVGDAPPESEWPAPDGAPENDDAGRLLVADRPAVIDEPD